MSAFGEYTELWNAVAEGPLKNGSTYLEKFKKCPHDLITTCAVDEPIFSKLYF